MAKLIYLASPIDKAPEGFAVRRLDIKTRLRSMGYSVFDPSQAFISDTGTEQIQAVNEVAIRNSDGVFVFYPPEMESVGVPREMRFAYSLGVPYVVCKDENDFARCIEILEKEMTKEEEPDERWMDWTLAVSAEMTRAQEKFPDSDRNTYGHWYGIYMEEVVEVAQAWNEFWAGRHSTLGGLLTEIEQVGAMAGRLWMKLHEDGPSEGESSTTTPEDGGS